MWDPSKKDENEMSNDYEYNRYNCSEKRWRSKIVSQEIVVDGSKSDKAVTICLTKLYQYNR